MATTTSLILYRGQGTGHVTGSRLLPRIGILSPTPLPGSVLNYSPWPQGGERHLHSSLGSKRRQALGKALHEAIEQEEPTPKRQRKPKKAPALRAEESGVPPTESHLTVKSERRTVGKAPTGAHDTIAAPTAPEPEYVPRITRTVSGIGFLRGRRRRAIQGTLSATAGGEGNAGRSRRRPRTGRLEPEGIENPTLEQIMLATAA
jgi:hypothetical protein